jgi:PIN domain nuclease of toxin-antitoxin system
VRVLLDTHVLLWWAKEPCRNSLRHRDIIVDPSNDVLFSAISLAEIGIKVSIGKLDVPGGLAAQFTAGGAEQLPFTAEHAEALRDLPLHHRDPFDRMLIAQAKAEGIPLLTVDEKITAYDIATI